jgi:hypothetical protein
MPLISSLGRRFGRNEEAGEAPPPDPGPSPGTQLLTNSDFIDKTGNAATGWTSSPGWQAYAFDNSGGVTNMPCVVTTMPVRAGVYPTSSSTGFVIFSYVTATVSQTISLTGLGGINSIATVLNIVNVSNGRNDTFNLTVTFKNASGVTIFSLTTGTINAPAAFTDYTLTLNRSGNEPNFNNIRSITVSITAIDSGFWGGQYGPAMDYCTLTVN